MPENIDYTFLSDLEGGSQTTGYVPAASVSKSGVTIATGFDLGQRGERDLASLKLDAVLIKTLSPYLGAKGARAKVLIDKSPLVITSAQAEEIDKAVKSAHVAQLKIKYDTAEGNKVKFTDLPSEAQTVITSVSFQYGVGLDRRTPQFWEAVTSQDWPEAIKILKDFRDAYPTRRKKEAMLLEEME